MAANAFTTATPTRSNLHQLSGGASKELDLPCEDECAIEKYPNLPASVHPGVLSGQAQLDLLQHARENGTNMKLKVGVVLLVGHACPH